MSFIMICIIHKILALLKITIILERFSSNMIDFYFSKNKKRFLHYMMKENPRPEKENITKDVRNAVRLEKLKNKHFMPQLKA